MSFLAEQGGYGQSKRYHRQSGSFLKLDGQHNTSIDSPILLFNTANITDSITISQPDVNNLATKYYFELSTYIDFFAGGRRRQHGRLPPAAKNNPQQPKSLEPLTSHLQA